MKKTAGRRAVVAGALAIPIVVLAYGYWFGVTHGALLISVTDVSDREHPRPLSPVTLGLLNADGRVLAEARSIDPAGAISLSLPDAYACWEIETRASFPAEGRRDWDRCFARQSRWIPTWIRRVTFIDLRTDSCALHGIPVTVSEYADTWWLWWVPMRHIGGKPYTTFGVSIQVDTHRCISMLPPRNTG